MASAFSDDQGNVIVLFVRAKPSNLLHNRRHQSFGGQFTISEQRLDQPLLSEFLFRVVERSMDIWVSASSLNPS
jgi:hypothetical protein